MRKCAGRSDPVWADEMGDGWGGAGDKSQRGLGLWEPLLLWSVKSTGSQRSTWPLQGAYSSKSACEARGDDVSRALGPTTASPQPQLGRLLLPLSISKCWISVWTGKTIVIVIWVQNVSIHYGSHRACIQLCSDVYIHTSQEWMWWWFWGFELFFFRSILYSRHH